MLNRSSKNLTTEQEAYDYALDMLSYRDYSHKDMELKLKRKGADAGIIKNTIQKLLKYGFLDEKRYSQRVFEAWLSKKYYGRSHLRLELQKKNVAERYINDILAQLSEAEEQERAEKALQSCLKRNPKNMILLRRKDGPLLAGSCMRVALQVNIFKKALIIYMAL